MSANHAPFACPSPRSARVGRGAGRGHSRTRAIFVVSRAFCDNPTVIGTTDELTDVVQHGATTGHQSAVLPVRHPLEPSPPFLSLLRIRAGASLLDDGGPIRSEQRVVPERDGRAGVHLVERLELQQALGVDDVVVVPRRFAGLESTMFVSGSGGGRRRSGKGRSSLGGGGGDDAREARRRVARRQEGHRLTVSLGAVFRRARCCCLLSCARFAYGSRMDLRWNGFYGISTHVVYRRPRRPGPGRAAVPSTNARRRCHLGCHRCLFFHPGGGGPIRILSSTAGATGPCAQLAQASVKFQSGKVNGQFQYALCLVLEFLQFANAKVPKTI